MAEPKTRSIDQMASDLIESTLNELISTHLLRLDGEAAAVHAIFGGVSGKYRAQFRRPLTMRAMRGEITDMKAQGVVDYEGEVITPETEIRLADKYKESRLKEESRLKVGGTDAE